MTLDKLKPGECAVITSIYSNNETLRPTTLGLIEGTLVKCLTELCYSIEISFYGQNMAISKHTAKRYSCKKLED